MKKIFTSTAALLLIAGSANSQAAKYALFEHFTQASCGPCASQNPGFESTILTPNPDKVRHIAYHTSWPGVDPMNAHNPTEVATRVSYYTVSGVPDVYMNGNQKNAQPGGFTQADVDDQFSMGSPIKIVVTEVDNGADRDVTVDVITVGTVPAGSYKLYAAVVEDPINYGTPPGSNGETHFPNVFRKMLPSTSGTTYTPAALGSSFSMTYNYVENAAWNMTNVKVIAFVQNTSTQEIINSGTVYDPTINYTLGNTGAASAAGTAGSPSTLTLSSINTGTAAEDFVYTLTTDAPGDWSAALTVNGSAFTSGSSVNTAAGATNTIDVVITPGTSPFVATYTLTVTSLATPTSPSILKKLYVISNVTDLVVSNTGGLGSGAGGNATTWEAVYMTGLASAPEPGAAKTTDVILEELGSSSSLTNVNNIYYNVGWTFPSLTDSEIPNLETFMDNGGNLFIAGQDMGWEIMDPTSGYGTPTTQGFFTGYLHGGFSADGGSTNTLLKAVAADAVYGTAANATINNYYGGSYFYPDELTTANGGSSIFTYNSTAKIGGLRYTNGTFKSVYLGVGPEMLSTTNANEVIKIAHDWFYGIITSVEADALFSTGYSVYPNPSNGEITVRGFDNFTELQVFDATGKLLVTKSLTSGVQQINLNNLEGGNYIAKFIHKNGSFVNQKLTFVK
ncbi:MAG TPA: Omp28-related outer membrane protein [Flavobacteriales bacterium]|nr:Omp28-related outer membrane protein [Flavobacteriales bacterium]